MDQKSIKIASEIKMPKRHPKMSQKMPNMAPKSAQVGAMLGSKTVLDASKKPKKTQPKKTSKKINPPRQHPGDWGSGGDRFPRLAQFYISLRRYRFYKTTSAPEEALPVIRRAGFGWLWLAVVDIGV